MELKQSRHIGPRMGARRLCIYRRCKLWQAHEGRWQACSQCSVHAACQAHQIDEESVASDGNHVIKAGCCHHGDGDGCSQGASISGSLSPIEPITKGLIRSSQLAGDHHTSVLHTC